MGKGSAKKPSEPKCRGCSGLLEGKNVVRIGGASWHKECAEKKGKKVPAEYKSQD